MGRGFGAARGSSDDFFSKQEAAQPAAAQT
jgi:hypothetical protein